MKIILNKIYRTYFFEIMTGVLVSLIVIAGLLIYSISDSTKHRNQIRDTTQNKLDSMRIEQSLIKSEILLKSDSLEISLRKKLDKINQKK